MSNNDFPVQKNILSKYKDSSPNSEIIDSQYLNSDFKELQHQKLLGSENSLLLKMKITNKYQYIQNKMIIISILLIFPLILTIIAIACDRWIESETIFFSLLYIHDCHTNENYSYADLISNNCKQPSQQNKTKCDMYDFFKIIGPITFIINVLSIILNLISEIILILRIRWPIVFQAIKSRTNWKMKMFSIFALIFYFIAILVFLFGALSKKTDDQKIGLYFYLALLGCLIYCGLFLYYWRIKRKFKNNRNVTKLLNPDGLLLRSDFGIYN